MSISPSSGSRSSPGSPFTLRPRSAPAEIRLDAPEEQPATQERAERLPRPLSRWLVATKYAPAEISEEHEVDEGGDIRRGARQVRAGGHAFSPVRGPLRYGLSADDGPGLSGIPAQSIGQKSGRGD